MIKSLLLALLLTGCVAPIFDSNEFQLLAQVKVNSSDLSSQCATVSAQTIHDKLTIPMSIAVEQIRHRRNGNVPLHADQTLLNMIASFEMMNRVGPHPSVVYCQEKLTNVADGADRLMTAYADLEN